MTSDTRDRFVAAALAVLERDGPGALQARRLATEVGVSTMGVYSHFGGMPQLVEAMMREGFARFAAQVRRVPQTDDAVADLISGGFAYGEFALANPQLYRLLMGVTEVPHLAVSPGALTTLAEGVDALSVLVDAVQRVIDAKRIRAQDATVATAQILSATHGYALLTIAGLVDPHQIQDVMIPLSVNLLVGLGDRRDRAQRSLSRAAQARAQAAMR